MPGDGVIGWRGFPATAWVAQKNAAGSQVITQVSLSDAKLTDLGAYNSAAPQVISLPNQALLITGDQAHLFSETGEEQAALPLPTAFNQVEVVKTSPTGEVFLSGVEAWAVGMRAATASRLSCGHCHKL